MEPDSRKPASDRRGDFGDDLAKVSTGYAKYAGAGVAFAVTILVFAYGGYRLDLWLDTSPWLLIVGVFLGFLGGMISLVSRVQKALPSRSGRDGPDDPHRDPN